MRIRTTLVTALAAGLLSLTAGSATAAPAGDAPADPGSGQACGAVRLTGSLPAPPPGMTVRQRITIDEDCVPRTGPARLAPSGQAGPETAAPAVPRTSATSAAADGDRRFTTWSEMYDCCGIRMTGLYTDSTWAADGDRITGAATGARQEWNREPWNAGWSLESSSRSADCLTDCAVSRHEAHADFSYRGIFDPTGNWYANEHHTFVELRADGTASCRFDVELKHSFVGWNWQRGCA